MSFNDVAFIDIKVPQVAIPKLTFILLKDL